MKLLRKMKIKYRILEWIKRVARKILSQEITEFHNQLINVTEQKRTWEGRYRSLTLNRATIPSEVLLKICEMLPNANLFAKGLITPQDLDGKSLQVVKFSNSNIHLSLRIAEINKSSIVFIIDEWNLKIRIPLHFENLKVGENTVIDTYVWDIVNSNIGGILDGDSTIAVTTFIRALNNISNE